MYRGSFVSSLAVVGLFPLEGFCHASEPYGHLVLKLG